jgi:hypothetical protein
MVARLGAVASKADEMLGRQEAMDGQLKDVGERVEGVADGVAELHQQVAHTNNAIKLLCGAFAEVARRVGLHNGRYVRALDGFVHGLEPPAQQQHQQQLGDGGLLPGLLMVSISMSGHRDRMLPWALGAHTARTHCTYAMPAGLPTPAPRRLKLRCPPQGVEAAALLDPAVVAAAGGQSGGSGLPSDKAPQRINPAIYAINGCAAAAVAAAANAAPGSSGAPRGQPAAVITEVSSPQQPGGSQPSWGHASSSGIGQRPKHV